MSANKYPSIWTVVPCFNRSLQTLQFLEYFKEQDYPNLHVIVVDDGSKDNTELNIKLNFNNTHVLYGDGSLWWSGGTNLGVVYALEHGADYILTINDDSKYEKSLVTSLYEVAISNNKYIVGSVQVEDGNESKIWAIGTSIDFSQQRLMRLNFAGDDISILSKLKNPYPVEFNPGNGVLIPRSVFETIGLYDEVNFPQYHADSEFLLRASRHADYKIVVSLKSIIVNHILTEPLVNNFPDLLYSNKSDLNWRALATLLLRYYPNYELDEAFQKLYKPYLNNIRISMT
jgi:GT2 family glycosyltransferase